MRVSNIFVAPSNADCPSGRHPLRNIKVVYKDIRGERVRKERFACAQCDYTRDR